jgi:hypothetical protein
MHDSPGSVDMRYVVPNNSKLCLYGTTFRIGDRLITVALQEKGAAKATFVEALDAGRAAILGQNLGDRLVEFALGNVPRGEPCVVEVKCALTAASSGPSATFLKFPLDVCTPSGSVACVAEQLRGEFAFSVRNTAPESVLQIRANVHGKFDSGSGTFTIRRKTEASALIVKTELRAPLASECISAGRYFALTHFIRRFAKSDRENNEFVFLIDCSGSTSGWRIAQARECLQIFIRSFPPDSFFNLVRFGSRFQALFPGSVAYDAATSSRALAIAQGLAADFGGTNIYSPLTAVFAAERMGVGLRQVFVITDGEVSDTDRVIALARENARENRCFTIALGSGADAGLVQGIADATGGLAAFIADGPDLTGKVIEQLEASVRPALSDVSVEVAGVDGIELAPFPLPALSAAVAQTVFGRAPRPLGDVTVLVSGDAGGECFDSAVVGRDSGIVEGVLGALFAYETIKLNENKAGSNSALRDKMIRLSIESGVLCSQTAFVGFSNEVFCPNRPFGESDYSPRPVYYGGAMPGPRQFLCRCAAPPPPRCVDPPPFSPSGCAAFLPPPPPACAALPPVANSADTSTSG